MWDPQAHGAALDCPAFAGNGQTERAYKALLYCPQCLLPTKQVYQPQYISRSNNSGTIRPKNYVFTRPKSLRSPFGRYVFDSWALSHQANDYLGTYAGYGRV